MEEKEEKKKKEKKELQRKEIFVKKGLQFRYILTVLFWSVLSFALAIHEIFWVADKLAIKNPAIKDIMSEFHALMPALAVKAAIFFAILIICSIIVSNQIAGPIHKFERGIRKLKSGDFTYRLYLRKGDYLTEIQTEYNEMATTMHKIVSEYEDFRSYAAGSSDEKAKQRSIVIAEEIKKNMPDMKL